MSRGTLEGNKDIDPTLLHRTAMENPRMAKKGYDVAWFLFTDVAAFDCTDHFPKPLSTSVQDGEEQKLSSAKAPGLSSGVSSSTIVRTEGSTMKGHSQEMPEQDLWRIVGVHIKKKRRCHQRKRELPKDRG